MSDDDYQRRRGRHKHPNLRSHQTPPAVGSRKPSQPSPRPSAKPASKPLGPHKKSNLRPNQTPPAAGPRKPAGPQKETSQRASGVADSSKVRSGPKIKAEPVPSPASTSAGKPNRVKPSRVPAIRFTEVQVAKRIKFSPKTLRNWRSSGKGPHFIKIGRLIRYRELDVITFEKAGWSGNRHRVTPQKIAPQIVPPQAVTPQSVPPKAVTSHSVTSNAVARRRGLR